MAPQPAFFCTDSLPAEKRAEIWNARVAEKLLRIQWDVPDGFALQAAMAPVLCAGDIEIASLALGPFVLTNTPEHARQKAHRVSLHILTEGGSVTTERACGRIDLRRTMGVLLDEGAYYRHQSRNALTRGLIVMLPKARLLERTAALDGLLAAPFETSCEPFRLLQAYLGLMSAGGGCADPELARLKADHVVDLIATALRARSQEREATQRRSLPRARLGIILEEIKRNLSDPKLSGGTVAARVGITERYLQQLMEGNGETFSHYLLRQRLERAAALLLSKREARVAEVAFLCGFNDLSYFNRSFKKRFSKSPRSLRESADHCPNGGPVTAGGGSLPTA